MADHEKGLLTLFDWNHLFGITKYCHFREKLKLTYVDKALWLRLENRHVESDQSSCSTNGHCNGECFMLFLLIHLIFPQNHEIVLVGKHPQNHSLTVNIASPSPLLNHVPTCHIYISFKYFQEWWVNYLHVLMLHNPFCEEIVPNIQ